MANYPTLTGGNYWEDDPNLQDQPPVVPPVILRQPDPRVTPGAINTANGVQRPSLSVGGYTVNPPEAPIGLRTQPPVAQPQPRAAPQPVGLQPRQAPVTSGIQYVYRPGGDNPELASPYGLIGSGGQLRPTQNVGQSQFPATRDPNTGVGYGTIVDYDPSGVGRTRGAGAMGISNDVRSVFPDRYSEMAYDPNTGRYAPPPEQRMEFNPVVGQYVPARGNVFLGSRMVADQNVAQDAASNVDRMIARGRTTKEIRQNSIRKLEADELQKIRDAAARGAGATGNAWAGLGATAKQPSKQDLADDAEFLTKQGQYRSQAEAASLPLDEFVDQRLSAEEKSDYYRKQKGWRSRNQPEPKPGSVGLTGGAAVGKEAPAKPAPSKDAIRKANPGKNDSELAPLFSKYGLE